MPRSSTSASWIPTRTSCHFAYTIERGVRFHDEPISLVGFRRVAIETMEPVLVNEDVARLSAAAGQPLVLSGEVPLSVVFVPLAVGGRATGVISLQNIDRENAFSESDVRLLTTLAGSLSVALENARLFEETRQRNAELALINEVQRGLVENLERAGDVRPRRRPAPRHLRCADRRHRRARPRRARLPFPVHDRARRAVPRQADGGDRVPQARRSRPRNRSWSTSASRSAPPSSAIRSCTRVASRDPCYSCPSSWERRPPA